MHVLDANRRIEDIVAGFGTHLHVDLQQRGVEYAQLFTKHVSLRPAIMERIPPLEHKSSSANQNHETGNGLTNGDRFLNGEEDMLLNDDLNGFGGPDAGPTAGRSGNPPSASKDSVRFILSRCLSYWSLTDLLFS